MDWLGVAGMVLQVGFEPAPANIVASAVES